MEDRRVKNAQIFKDTEDKYKNNYKLKEAIKNSINNQVFYSEKEIIKMPIKNKNNKTQVIVSSKRSLAAAETYAKKGKKVCVLNFASATNPGGGVINGSSAQEECICRATTLYPCLNTEEMWNSFYLPHRKAQNPLYNNDCIYTPNVCVFKSDINFPELLNQNEWWNVSIITCAAPNLRLKPSNFMNPFAGDKPSNINQNELEQLLTKRIKRIFDIALLNENEVLILGAFGCGAFQNPPQVVAKVFYNVMQNYLGYFETIEYAIYHSEREISNFEAFVNVMNS